MLCVPLGWQQWQRIGNISISEQIEPNPFMQVLARAVADEAFRAALLADTAGTLKAQVF